jgi:hypothetical protein
MRTGAAGAVDLDPTALDRRQPGERYLRRGVAVGRCRTVGWFRRGLPAQLARHRAYHPATVRCTARLPPFIRGLFATIRGLFATIRGLCAAALPRSTVR